MQANRAASARRLMIPPAAVGSKRMLGCRIEV
jgi:hypothetical protein